MGSSVILPPQGQPGPLRPGEFKGAAIPNAATFGFRNLGPPSPLYVQRGDVLRIVLLPYLATGSALFSYRLLLATPPAPGQPEDVVAGRSVSPIVDVPEPAYLESGQFALNATAALTPVQQSIVLAEGWLLSVSVATLSDSTSGRNYVVAFLTTGPSVSGVLPSAYTLFTGYLRGSFPLGWPGGPIENETDGQGFLNAYAPANPAAGTDLSVISNAPGRVQLLAFKAQFATSATVANRFPSFLVSYGASSNAQVQDTTAIPASTTVIYSLGPGQTFIRGGGAPAVVALGTPGLHYVGSNVTIASSTQGIQAGDQWSAITFSTREWFANI